MTSSSAGAPRPLGGRTVVDAASWVAGPFCARILAWLGSDVIKLTGPDGDPLRALGEAPDELGACLNDYVNAQKRVVKTASTDEFRKELFQLLGRADVLVCDWSPARQRELGVSLGELRLQFARLVIVCVTGYGLSGPHADWPAAEATTYHAGGEGYLLPGGDIYRTYPDRPPVRGGRFLADYDAGLAAAVGALAGTIAAEITGNGDLVDVSSQEVELGLNRTTLSRAFFEHTDYDRSYRGYDYAGVLRCLDGYICLRPSEEAHWQSFCSVIGRVDLANDRRFNTRARRFENGPALNEELERWTTTVPRSVVRAAINEAGAPGGPYLSPREILDDPAINSRQLIRRSPIGDGRSPAHLWHGARWEVKPSQPALRYRMAERAGSARPLEGLRIVDLTWVAAGPYATELLAFLGADVIRVESWTQPDLFRRGLEDPADLDGSIRFVDLNQGKRSICLNLKDDSEREMLLALVRRSDVLIENFRPGVRERLGIGDAALAEQNPALVAVGLSGFGATADDALRPGYASIFSAEAGISVMTGYPDAPPADIRDTNDLRAGTAAALGVLSAVLDALLDGRGSTIDVAARDVLIALQGDALLQASRGGEPIRSANTLPTCVPYDCYRTSNGWVMIAVRTPGEWTAFQAALNAPELRLPEYDTSEGRVRARAAIDRTVSQWCASKTAEAVAEFLCAAGVPAAASSSCQALGNDTHLRAREFFGRTEHPRFGEIDFVGSPLRFASAPSAAPVRPPLIDEHAEAIIRNVLGLAQDPRVLQRAP